MKSFLKKTFLSLIKVDKRHTIAEKLVDFPLEEKNKIDPDFNERSGYKLTSNLTVSPPSLAKLRNLYIWDVPSLILSPKGFSYEHLMLNERALLSIDKKVLIKESIKSFLLNFKKKKTEEKIILSTLWDQNYFHWTLEVLPKLIAAQSFIEKNNIKIVISPIKHQYQKEWLDMLGIKKSCFEVANGSREFLSGAYIFNFHRKYGRSHAKTLGLVSQLAKKIRPSELQTKEKKIYITRNDARRRSVINEQELLEHIVPLGYEVVQLSGMSVKKQMALFGDVTEIIAPHGAGLTNLIFCNKNRKVKVLEFLPKSNPVMCYASLSLDLGLEYQAYYSEMEGQHFKIDLESFRLCLSKWI